MRSPTISAIASAALLIALGGPAAGADTPPGAPATPSGSTGYKVGDRLAPQVRAAPAPSPRDPKATEYKLTNWDQLLPKDWNPLKDLQNLNLSLLSDADPRAQAALARLKREWENAPTEASMDNQRIRIAGFVVPLEGEADKLREFLLVPYFGACIHVPPPPSNQIIHVKAAKPVRGVRAMEALWVSGRLRATVSDTKMGTSGYQMEAERIEPYREKP